MALQGNQYPAVAMINDRLTVVAAVGENPAFPSFFMGYEWLPNSLRYRIQEWQLRIPALRIMFGVKAKPTAIITFDADTGDEIWRWFDKPWDFYSCAGDESGIHDRVKRQTQRGPDAGGVYDPRVDIICGPDSWGIPTVGADGVIYATSGHNGMMHAIRDDNRNGVIEPEEVLSYDTGSAFLNGPALAPGMLVAAPCWGPMLVFNADDA